MIAKISILTGFMVVVSLRGLAVSAEDTVVLDNGVMRMTINRIGGAVSGCTLAGQGLNPFSWKANRSEEDKSMKEGLFTCFDRVGRSSAEDAALGIPFHGEAASVEWNVLERETSDEGHLVLRMRCELPITGMTLEREYCLFRDSSVCRVRDRIRNTNPFPKTWNVLMHPSHAPPFLDSSVLVDCNAVTGFVKTKDRIRMPGALIGWPEIRFQERSLNLRYMTNGVPLVVNYLCEEGAAYGWGCTSNPERGLMTGFLWPVSDYSWTRIWQEWSDGKPSALGIEFGTTPLGIPMKEIEHIGPLLDRSTFETLESGEETMKTFHFFLLEIPRDFSGVGTVGIRNGTLNVKERTGDESRQWNLPCTD